MSTLIFYVQVVVAILFTEYTTDFEDVVAKFSGESVHIEWKSTINTSSQYFEVQRTSDNESFKTIALIMTIEDVERKKSFSYTDKISNRSSIIKYRIKKVSINNHMVFSPVLECDLKKETKDL